MFTAQQIKEELSKVRTGADFPVLATVLKNIGVAYYETKMEDGSSIYHGPDGYELISQPNYAHIEIADKVNLEQLKLDISNHQQGKSDYFQVSKQCADNGIDKWAVCLLSMTCTYIDKTGNKVLVEHIPDAARQPSPFTVDQIKAAHSKVKSGADFPGYIKVIKALGVTQYETYVTDGHIDYYGANNHTVKSPAKYDPLLIAAFPDKQQFESELKAHQQGKTSFLAFIQSCAKMGINRWEICMEQMTCTYYDRAGNKVLVEEIPE